MTTDVCYKQSDKHVLQIFKKYGDSQAHLLKIKPGYGFQEFKTKVLKKLTNLV